MLAFVVIFVVAATISFLFFQRSMRLDLSSAFFASLLSAIVLGLIAAAAVHVGALF